MITGLSNILAGPARVYIGSQRIVIDNNSHCELTVTMRGEIDEPRVNVGVSVDASVASAAPRKPRRGIDLS